jgi:hypothetical protein
MLAWFRRRALLRGPLGGSRQWTLIWAILLGAKLVRRVTKPEPEVVFTGRLEDGASIVITAGEREPRVIGGTSTTR